MASTRAAARAAFINWKSLGDRGGAQSIKASIPASRRSRPIGARTWAKKYHLCAPPPEPSGAVGIYGPASTRRERGGMTEAATRGNADDQLSGRHAASFPLYKKKQAPGRPGSRLARARRKIIIRQVRNPQGLRPNPGASA